MRIPRIYHPGPLASNQSVALDADAANHVSRVLRLGPGEALVLFNGEGGQYSATIEDAGKKQLSVRIGAFDPIERESPLTIHLGQVISRGERMEFTIQKSVELGVNCITPLFSERCGVKLPPERLAKKVQQWQKIVVGACEQSGRNRVPRIHQPQALADWLAQPSDELKLNLHPRACHSIRTLPQPGRGLRLLIGPEGGLTDDEIAQTRTHGFLDMLLGPRILRTETAALTALTALQCHFGDLA